jgi:hypothetical protein
VVAVGYFVSLGIRVREGRGFEASEPAVAPAGVVVDRGLAD